MPCDALIKLMLSLFYTTLNITATIHKLIVFSRSLCEEQREIDNRITNERLTPVIERENKAQTHPYYRFKINWAPAIFYVVRIL